MIDLRSDTVTRPGPEMRSVMAAADVGDDVFGEDPTVNALQGRLSAILGKEAAIFVPSGTMANEICIKCHTQPGDEVICESGAHILNYESGAAALLSSVQLRPLDGYRGILDVRQVKENIRPPLYHFPNTALIAAENTHNSAGGTIYPVTALSELYALVRNENLKLHLDGARIWNAAVASGLPVSDYAQHCDSISVCFSKGLGAPVGSAIAGPAAFIDRARKVRKMFGGGMRQAGILAAAAMYALEHNVLSLAEDHKKAQTLALALAELSSVTIDLSGVQTNIIIFQVEHPHKSMQTIVDELRSKGVQVVPFGPARLRAVTHRDVAFEEIEQAARVFASVLG
jgi:threonine aldolase